jgi:DNA repair protein RecN (Recombination protein N)
MLTELTIRDFAIIDDLTMSLAPGFTVLTGETGAGKSIILDAVMLLLGGRADTTMVRSGCEAAYVEGLFALPPYLQERVNAQLAAEEVESDDPAHLLLAREVRLSGRNICRVNGRAVTLNFLRDVAESLVDIHGQGEHLSLLRPRAHLPLLDGYGGLNAERRELGREASALRKLENGLAVLRRDARELAKRQDMLEFQIAEIDAASLQPGEEDDLRAERTRLANVEQLMQVATEALAMMVGVDDEMPAVADLLSSAERSLSQLIRLDPTKETWLEKLQGLISEFADLSAELRDYQDELEFNPGRLDFIEERLELIGRLKRKYGDDIEAVLAWRDEAAAELHQITHSEERAEELEALIEKGLRRVGAMAQALSYRRQEAAQRLAGAVERELVDLRMEGARFAVDFAHSQAENGAYVGDERLAFDATGIDQVEFLISTNPGEPLKPMARVASGGETARLMLALKTALAQVDETPTLIFDEIDQGIGGRVGGVVGRKLWGLAAHGDHQVVVVTHLPQLAGFGDAHYHVSKGLSDGRTITAVTRLDGGSRVSELAAMLGTQDDTARSGAESILQQAEQAKQRV